jgi:predicted HTH transcriptional regulator
VAMQGKLVAEITRADIRELVRTRAAEDLFVDFKQVIFHPAHRRPDSEAEDILSDVVSFANAAGGHIVIGIEDRNDAAWELRPMSQANSRRIATKLKALAIQHIKPPIVPLEVVPMSMHDYVDEWIVIVSIPEGQAKPHMCGLGQQTTFTIRDGNRKRPMTADEIQNAFLSGPQQSALANIFRELQTVSALVETLRPRSKPWWRPW